MLNCKPNVDRLIADTQALVRIQSVNPYDDAPATNTREQEIADWLGTAMTDIGLEVERFEVVTGRPNIWGRLKGKSTNAPTLMLAGHMDTVAVDGYDGDPFEPKHEGGKIFGRGSVDMKGPLACFLETARIAKTMDLQGDLLLGFVCDEEDKMIGSVATKDTAMNADFCIVGEPSLLTVCTAHKGQMIFKIEISGTACHSSNPANGVNAISAAADLITHMAAYDKNLQDKQVHSMCGSAFFTPVMINGGETHSTVPGQAYVQFDRRVIPGETETSVRNEIQNHLDILNERHEATFLLGDPMPNTLALNTDQDLPIVAATLSAASKVTGQTQTPLAFPGGTDAPNFACPTVICGPGDLAQAHTINEFIEVEQMEKAVMLYLDVIDALLT